MHSLLFWYNYFHIIKIYMFITYFATIMFIVVQFFFFFLAALGLRCCTRAFSSWGEWGLLFIVVSGLLIVVASPVEEDGPQGAWASVVAARGLSICNAWALGRCGSVVVVHGLSCSVATRDQTRVPCIGRQILNHCATREAPSCLVLILHFSGFTAHHRVCGGRW